MTRGDWQTEEFERDRQHLQSVAYRMVGSASEAEDRRSWQPREPAISRRW